MEYPTFTFTDYIGFGLVYLIWIAFAIWAVRFLYLSLFGKEKPTKTHTINIVITKISSNK
ncbi:hypothetical protein AGMMS49525_10550 [Bacteroidia bacterium]|nr:hypothetical protein AGMMS49525_10550 [Bacteroidia bacterium]